MTLDLLRSALATVAAIPVTPFGPDGQVDWDAHDRVIRRMVDAGVRLVTPNGNTGEFYALTAAEARRATESAVAAAAGSGAEPPADVVAGVGHDLPSAIEAGQHARDHGVRMIMVHQPVGPYISAAGWLEYHRAIAGALPDLGVVLYIRDPRIGGRHIRALGDLCPNVIAVKYGIRDPVQFAEVARDAGLDRFTWLVHGLVVHPDRMRRNLDATHGLYFSQRLLLALVESGLARDDAYRLVQRNAMRAWDEELDFRVLVRDDPDILVDLDAVFDESAYTRHVDIVFDRLHDLVKEPVHA